MLRTVLFSLIAGAVLLLFGYPSFAQKQVNKFPHAIERSGDAGAHCFDTGARA